MVYTENIDFEWDFVKAVTNVIKHGVTFEQATLVFYDLGAYFIADDQHSFVSEVREKYEKNIEENKR
jgi:uncharacterized DUF497 family protein